MLESMRQGAQSIWARILFIVLIAAFALWGVPTDFVGQSNAVAKIGDAEISSDSFKRAFDNQLNNMSRQNGGKFDRTVALAMGIDKQVLERLVGQGALLKMADTMKLGLSDETIAAGIKADPDFAGPDGKFSKLNYEGLLQQAGLSEQGFLRLRREDDLRAQITDAIAGATVAPSAMAEVRRNYEDETRTLAHFTIDANKISVADPDDAKLNTTYNDNKSRFMTDETRKLAVLTLTVEDLKSAAQVTDDDVKKSYEDTKAVYDKPEKRRVQQITFKDTAAAEEAKKAIAAGTKKFMDAATDAGLKETDVNLGFLTKKQMVDAKVAEAVFAAKRDDVVGPIEGTFAIVLARAIEVEDGKISTFDEVKDKVKDALLIKKAEALVTEKVDLVIEARNAGKTLKEISDELKLKFFDVPAITRDNRDPNGTGPAALNFTDARKVVDAAFATSPGEQADAIELGKVGYAWFDTLAVTPSRQKTLEEAKDAVKALYLDNERNTQLNDLAKKLVDRLKSGEDSAKVALDAGGKLETSQDIKRMNPLPGVSADGIRQAFALGKNGVGHAPSSDGASRSIFKVLEIKAPGAATKEDDERLSKRLQGELSNDHLFAFVDGLKTKLGVTTNEKLLKRLTGADQQ
jgi:peptidyl-prolyl cis-trans isomerase D